LADSDAPDDERSPEGGPSPLAEASAPPAPAEPAAAPTNPSEQRARLAEDRLAEVLAAYRTLKNENEDFRERQSRNLERRFEQRRERLLLKFIDVLDNLDRGLEAAQTSYAGQPLLEGMILVRTQLLQTLQDEGLDRIPVLGLPFDPAVSESVGTEAVKEAEQHHLVVKELLRGYRLNGRIVRPSRVLIGIFAGAEAPAAAPEGAAVPAVAETPSAETPIPVSVELPPAEAAVAPVVPEIVPADVASAEALPVAPASPPPLPTRPATQSRRKGR
jgi:molecular chaperone GrpE